MIKRILMGVLVLSMMFTTGIISWLKYEYDHPYICTYLYKEGTTIGKSYECGQGNDILYCRKDAITMISVDSFSYRCGRQ